MRFFKEEDIPFVKSLLAYQIPLMFMISHCENEEKGMNMVNSLQVILRQNQICNTNIHSLSLVAPFRGYANLLSSLYELLEKHQITNVQQIREQLAQGNIQFVINEYLRKTVFFNNIKSPLCIANQINRKVNAVIGEFSLRKFNDSLSPDIRLFGKYSELKRNLVEQIGLSYGITVENAQIDNFFSSLNVVNVIRKIRDQDVEGLNTKFDFLNYANRIQGYENFDSELFKTVYQHALPYLTKASHKKNLIGYFLLGYNIKVYFREMLTDGQELNNNIMQGILHYNRGIESFNEILKEMRLLQNNV